MVSAGYFGERDLLKLTLLSGAESNGQAYTAVPLDVLREDPRANPIDGVGDRFRQSMAALTYTRLLSALGLAGDDRYGFDAGGWYRVSVVRPAAGTADWEWPSRWGGAGERRSMPRAARHLRRRGARALTYRRDHMFRRTGRTSSTSYANRGTKQEAVPSPRRRHLARLTPTATCRARASRSATRPHGGSRCRASASWGS
jgi:hypothetical protein